MTHTVFGMKSSTDERMEQIETNLDEKIGNLEEVLEEKNWKIGECILFRLFPIISISQRFFFLTLEKIGIDKKVICYHNISN